MELTDRGLKERMELLHFLRADMRVLKDDLNSWYFESRKDDRVSLKIINFIVTITFKIGKGYTWRDTKEKVKDTFTWIVDLENERFMYAFLTSIDSLSNSYRR